MPRIKRIDRAEIFTVRLPLVKPFETSFGVETHKTALLLRVASGDAEGWGECVASPDPFYSYETNLTALHIIEDFLIPAVREMNDFTVEEALATFRRIRGHHMAKATVENALLDLTAKQDGIPIYQLIGGQRKPVPSGISIGIKERVDDLLGIIGEAVDKRYGRIKIKIKRGRDVEVLRAVRDAFPEIRLMADANADYTLDDIDILKQFDAFNLMMIEQPLNYDDIHQHALVQKQIDTPVCLDESIKGLKDAKTAAQLESCRIINIKQGRVGGILNAKAISEFCRGEGIPVWSGGMLETGIGRAFNIHLQTLPGFTLPGDTSETSRYFHEDIVDRPVILQANGTISIPGGPGIGVQVVRKKLDAFRVSHKKLSV